MIDGAPQVMHLPVDPYENLVQVPLPVRIRLVMNPPLSYLSSEHRTESIPPEPYRLVADIDAAFMQQVFDLPQV